MRACTVEPVVLSDLPDEEEVHLAVEVFRMLAEATRVRLLWVLLRGEASVNQLADAVGKPQAAVSQHLAKLRMAHLVQTRRHGTHVFYSVASEHVRQLVVDAIFHAEHASGGAPAHHRGDSGLTTLTPPCDASQPVGRDR
jgi:DNA-binding transcriptional ArsR family regulator